MGNNAFNVEKEMGNSKNRKAFTGNAMMIIFPKKEAGVWVFDDDARGLVNEPFILGIPEMIESIMAYLGIEVCEDKQIKFIFSRNKFPGYHACINKIEDELGGAWYKVENSPVGDMSHLDRGWLCPATLLYFETMPDSIYIRIEE